MVVLVCGWVVVCGVVLVGGVAAGVEAGTLGEKHETCQRRRSLFRENGRGGGVGEGVGGRKRSKAVEEAGRGGKAVLAGVGGF